MQEKKNETHQALTALLSLNVLTEICNLTLFLIDLLKYIALYSLIP